MGMVVFSMQDVYHQLYDAYALQGSSLSYQKELNKNPET